MNTPAPTYYSFRHFPSLDGLRGIAILLVISKHYFGFIPAFSFGWSGVDLFFVLSGYLITGRLLESLNKPAYFGTFYRNRVLRIFPLYYGVLIIFFIGIHFFTKKETQPLLAFYFIHWKSFFLFTENWSFINYYMPPAPYLLHFWSLAIEEQFYLLWPILLYLLKDRNIRLKVFAAIPLLILITRSLFHFYQPHSGNLPFYYFNTFFRIDSFVLGALLCQVHYANIRIPEKLFDFMLLSSLTILCICAFVRPDMNSYSPFFETVGYTVIALFYTCLLHKAVAHTGSFTEQFLSAQPFRFIGKISYGLYIFHFPVLLIFQQRLYEWSIKHIHMRMIIGEILSACLCLLITFLLSLLSFRYFESFFLRLKKE